MTLSVDPQLADLLVIALGRELFFLTLAVVLTFGVAALIYLIAEELLVESVQTEKVFFPRSCFLAGFLF